MLYPVTVEVLAVQVSVTEAGVLDAAVKLTPVAFAPLMVTLLFAGVNVKPELLGVTV
jgi:hypothetical protein